MPACSDTIIATKGGQWGPADTGCRRISHLHGFFFPKKADEELLPKMVSGLLVWNLNETKIIQQYY